MIIMERRTFTFPGLLRVQCRFDGFGHDCRYIRPVGRNDTPLASRLDRLWQQIDIVESDDTLFRRQRIHDFRLLILTFTPLRKPWHSNRGLACDEAVTKAAKPTLGYHHLRCIDPLPDSVVRHEIMALDMVDWHRRMPNLGDNFFSAAGCPTIHRCQQAFKRIGIGSQHNEYHRSGPPYTALG